MKINPISVTELNLYVKNKVAEDEYLNNVYVAGLVKDDHHRTRGLINSEGEEVALKGHHAYSVLNVDDKFIFMLTFRHVCFKLSC